MKALPSLRPVLFFAAVFLFAPIFASPIRGQESKPPALPLTPAAAPAGDGKPADASKANASKLKQKLEQIIFPSINFRETTLRDAIEFLVQKSKQLDPEGEGVNIVLRLGDRQGVAVPPPEIPPG